MRSFLKAVVRHFSQIGGVLPSTPFAARTVARNVPEGSKSIVEYGPGTGVITKEILKRISSAGKVYAIDVNPDFVEEISHIGDKRLILECSDVLEFCEKIRKLEPNGVDAVVSGIPLSFLDDTSRDELFRQTKAALKSEGRFIIYQNSPESWWLLKKHFSNCTHSVEFRNIPPYFILVGFA